MVDIHSATAEIRRGKKEERRRNRTKIYIMSASAIRRAAIRKMKVERKKPQDEKIMACRIP